MNTSLRTFLTLTLLLITTQASALTESEAAGQTLVANKGCAGCHGGTTLNGGNASLIALTQATLITKLKSFRGGSGNSQMVSTTNDMTDTNITNIAAYIQTLKPQPSTTLNPDHNNKKFYITLNPFGIIVRTATYLAPNPIFIRVTVKTDTGETTNKDLGGCFINDDITSQDPTTQEYLITYTFCQTGSPQELIPGRIIHIPYGNITYHNYTLCLLDSTNPTDLTKANCGALTMRSPATFTAPEGTTTTHTLQANDTTATFTLTENPANLFSLNNKTLTFNATTLDFDTLTTKTFTATINARTGTEAAQNTTQQITVTLTDLNDEPPTTLTLSGSRNISENTPVDTILGTLSTTDADATNNFSYTSSNPIFEAFFAAVDSKVRLKTAIDYESLTNKTLTTTIEVNDGNNNKYSKDFTFTITDVNDNPPTNLTLSTTTIPNIIPTTHFATLTTTDLDTVGTHTYTLTPDTTTPANSADNSAFTITNNKLSINATPTKQTYKINITTTDPIGAFSKPLTLTLSNTTPTAITLNRTTQTIPENTQTALLLATLTTTDPDATDTHTYTLPTTDPLFEIRNNNKLYLKPTATIDYEITQQITAEITTTDAASHTLTQSFPFQITDLNDNPPTNLTLSTTIITNTVTPDTQFATLQTTDPDTTPTTHTYTLTPATSDTSLFTLTEDGKLSIKATPTKSTYTLNITTTDPDTTATSNSFTKSVTLTVQSATPPIISSPTKYFITTTKGLFINSHATTLETLGQSLEIKGSIGDDKVLVGLGTTIDATKMTSTSGNDAIYLIGNRKNYTESHQGSQYTLTRIVYINHTNYQESVTFFASTGDTLYFADGAIDISPATLKIPNTSNFKDLKDITLNPDKTTPNPLPDDLSTPQPTSPTKIFITDINKTTIAPAVKGSSLEIKGSIGDDSVLVGVGTIVDATKMTSTSGNDAIYLTGTFANYPDKSHKGSQYTVSRTIKIHNTTYTESVTFFTSTNDKLYFADGFINIDAATLRKDGIFQPLSSTMLNTITPVIRPFATSTTPTIKQFTVTQQNGAKGTLIPLTTHPITITADILPLNATNLRYEWSSPYLLPTPQSTPSIHITTPNLTQGNTYPITLRITNNNGTTTRQLHLKITPPQTPSSPTTDTDGNNISDHMELPHPPHKLSIGNNQYMYAPIGIKLSAGNIAMGSASAKITLTDIKNHRTQNALTALQTDTYIPAHIYDYQVEWLPAPGATTTTTLKVTPILPNTVLRTYTSTTNSWNNFQTDENNKYYTATVPTNTPCPASNADWGIENTLTENANCLKIIIQDGGTNDTDTQTNGSIDNPLSLSTPL